MPLPRLIRVRRKRKPEAPVPGFDPAYYLDRYPDVAANGGDPLEHYLVHGRHEGRDPNPYFSAAGYLRANPDVAASGLDPLTHFIERGLAAGYGGWQQYPRSVRPPASAEAAGAEGPGLRHLDDAFAAYLKAEIAAQRTIAKEQPENRAIDDVIDYYQFHESRWLMTFRAMSPLLTATSSVIEVGGGSVVSNFLALQGLRVTGTTNDLRYPMEGIADGTHDAVLCLEVIEHIKDQDGSVPVDTFNGTGVRCFVSEMFRILRPGGIAVCTTPNACSYSSIAQAILMEPPMFLRDHVREFTPRELRGLFEGAGFETRSIETPAEPWGARQDIDVDLARKVIAQGGGRTDLREDDILAIFRKP